MEDLFNDFESLPDINENDDLVMPEEHTVLIEKPEEEMEPPPEEIDYVGLRNDPNMHDSTSVEDYIAEEREFLEQQEALRNNTSNIDNVANDHIENTGFEDSIANENEKSPANTEQNKYIEKMEKAHAKAIAIDKGLKKDAFVERANYQEKVYAYKAGEKIDGKDVTRADVLEAYSRMIKTNLLETAIERTVLKREERKDEHNAPKDANVENSEKKVEDEILDISKEEVLKESDFIDTKEPDENVESNNADYTQQNDTDTDSSKDMGTNDSELDKVDETVVQDTINEDNKNDIASQETNDESVDKNIENEKNTENKLNDTIIDNEKLDESEYFDTEDDNNDIFSVFSKNEDDDPGVIDDDMEKDADTLEHEEPYEIDIINIPEVVQDIEDNVDKALSNEDLKDDEKDNEHIESDEDNDDSLFENADYPGFEEDFNFMNDVFKDSPEWSDEILVQVKDIAEEMSDYFDVTIDDVLALFSDRWTENGVDADEFVEDILSLRDDEIELTTNTPTIDFGDDTYSFDIDTGVFDVNEGVYVDAYDNSEAADEIERNVLSDVDNICDENINDIEFENYNDIENVPQDKISINDLDVFEDDPVAVSNEDVVANENIKDILSELETDDFDLIEASPSE